MQTGSVEQSLRQQVKEEIGDAENLTFREKNILSQKFGIQPTFVPDAELKFWEDMEAREQ